ncbi:MAG: iron-sulfur cluster repair di-iron protein [Cyclobacteriaceae bacterium]
MVFEKTLAEIVDENYVYARALHYLGISFFENPNIALSEICRERGLDREKVIRSFYLFDSCTRLSFQELRSYPIDLLVEYLKHSHHLFIKDKLPFIIHLAKNCNEDLELQKLLPEFVEDFIKHIYEEEDSVFSYVQILNKSMKGLIANPISALLPFENFSLSHEFEHHQGDDEMQAIRSLVESAKPSSLKEEVLVKEVKAFDREMLYHAEIENIIFFPKAIQLEEEVYVSLRKMSLQN